MSCWTALDRAEEIRLQLQPCRDLRGFGQLAQPVFRQPSASHPSGRPLQHRILEECVPEPPGELLRCGLGTGHSRVPGTAPERQWAPRGCAGLISAAAWGSRADSRRRSARGAEVPRAQLAEVPLPWPRARR